MGQDSICEEEILCILWETLSWWQLGFCRTEVFKTHFILTMAKKSELLKVGSKEDALSGGLRKYNEREGCFIRLIVMENMLYLGKMSRRK